MSTPEHPGSPDDPATEPTIPMPPTHHPYGARPQQPGVPPVPPAPPMSAPPGGYYGQPMYAPQPPTDGAGIAAFVIGIVGLTFACAYGFGLILSPVALFVGRSAMKRIDASQGQLGGRGFAQAGFIMGIIGTVLLVLGIAAVVAFFGLLFGTDCFGDGC